MIKEELDYRLSLLHLRFILKTEPYIDNQGVESFDTLPTQARLGPMGYANAYKDDWRKPILVKGEDKFGHLKYWTSVEELLAGKAGAGVPSTAR